MTLSRLNDQTISTIILHFPGIFSGCGCSYGKQSKEKIQ